VSESAKGGNALDSSAPSKRRGKERERPKKKKKTLLKKIILDARGAIHQLLSIILKLRILVLLPVSTMPYVVMVKNYS
jgi:hypothetical protein